MIVPMKWMTLVALKEDEDGILHALQSLSAVQIVRTEEQAECETLDSLVTAENRVQQLNSSLRLLRPYGEKKSMLRAKPEVSVTAITDSVAGALKCSEQIDAISRDKASLRTQKEKAEQLKASLEPWAALETPIENIRSTGSTSLYTGMLAAKDLSRLEELSDCAAVQVLDGVNVHAVLILCQNAEAERVGALLKQLGWVDFVFPKIQGAPAQAIAALNGQIKGFEAQEEAAAAQLLALAARRDELEGAADAAAIARDRELAKAATGKTASAFLLEGWARSDRMQEIESAVASVTDAYHMEMRDPTEEEVPPSVVKNSPLIAPFETVTNLYSRPDPRGIDGTPLMAFFYALFFGMMLSDTGYGIVLFIGGLLYIKFIKPTGMMGGIVKVVTMGSLSTIICGLFIGTFFGMDWNVVFGTPVGTFPLLFDPMLEPMGMLYLCFGLGLAHMIFGICIKIYLCMKAKDYAGAIFDNLSWLIVIIGLLILGLVPSLFSVGAAMAVIGGAVVLIFAGRERPNVIKRFIKGAGTLYNVTGYLSDMLSYSRIFALGLSTGVIASVLNMLGGMLYESFSGGIVLNIIGFVLAAAFLVGLHMFNICINVLGCFIHSARLQFVEFYGKFYEAGGTPFTPLGYSTRSVKIKV